MKISYQVVANTTNVGRLADVPEGATIVSIDDKLVVGRCEACQRIIFQGQIYGWGEDSLTCSDCLPECGEEAAHD